MLTIDIADQVLMTVHPPTAERLSLLYTSCLMEDWHTRRAFYAEQVDRANNAHLSAWWVLVLQLFDAALADPDGSEPKTIRIMSEHDAAYAALTADEIHLWNDVMAWHLETNVERDQWVEARQLARKTREAEGQP